MAQLPAYSITATKQANGDTLFNVFVGTQLSPISFVAQWRMPSADTTTLNTTVFGGASGATSTFNYGSVLPTGGDFTSEL